MERRGILGFSIARGLVLPALRAQQAGAAGGASYAKPIPAGAEPHANEIERSAHRTAEATVAARSANGGEVVVCGDVLLAVPADIEESIPPVSQNSQPTHQAESVARAAAKAGSVVRHVALGILLTLCGGPVAFLAADRVPLSVPQAGPRDLCPVCGMLVSKYPNWMATLVWRDRHAHYFDGAKDMFKFLQALPAYAPGRRRDDINVIVVTEFYNLDRIDARKALYVIGSDVMGPMGHEFVPFATRADADDFLKDHKGKRILGFNEVTPEVVAKVDTGKF